MYGRSDAEWEQLVAAGTEFLDECVRSGRTTSYTELTNKLVERTGTRAFDFSLEKDRRAVGYLLGQIVTRDFPTRRFMLSAVVRYSDSNDAGPGFYKLAQQMGLLKPNTDRLAFWTEQLRGLGVR
ncbi:hypothetical protein [Cellulomonas endometrii]|uniref:hypothetical protein n=1 Tax=Cellulomonas endometrii TaxID=3036301 RepID=UPI0024ACD92C|nr:hypothetical protein [Cellulomonas endometrii]